MSNEERKKERKKERGVGIYILCTCRREMEGLNKRAAPISSLYYSTRSLLVDFRPSPLSRIDTETGRAYSVLYKSKLAGISSIHACTYEHRHTQHTRPSCRIALHPLASLFFISIRSAPGFSSFFSFYGQASSTGE